MDSSRKIVVARGETDSEGPDLGLLILSPEKDVGIIKAKKTFYNLSKRRDMILSNPPPIEMGGWGLSGIAHEWTEDAPPERGFKRVKIFKGMCGFGKLMKEYKKDDYDFLEIGAKYTKGYEGPESYGGFSGGGLWHVLIERSRNGTVKIKDRILSGVAFYQEPVVDSIRIIRCNGRQSIYKKVIEKIHNEFS